MRGISHCMAHGALRQFGSAPEHNPLSTGASNAKLYNMIGPLFDIAAKCMCFFED